MIGFHLSERASRRARSEASANTDFSFQGIIQRNRQHMDAAFQSVVNAILRFSELDIDFIRISNVTDDSFLVSLEARASKTGPAKATLSPMTVELHSVAGCFGKITLPEIITTPGGSPIVVEKQIVQITDTTALQFFVVPAIKRNIAKLSLKNGQCMICVPALGVAPQAITYERDIRMDGMNGPHISVNSVTVIGRPSTPIGIGSNTNSLARVNVAITLHIANPSPIEISFGICEFEIRNSKDQVFAELKGHMDIRRDRFNVTFQGIADKRVALAGGNARLVGRRCVGAGWCDETIKGIDLPIHDTWKLLKALGLEYQEPPPEEEEPEPRMFRWRGKWWRFGTWI
ncbi:hypothetical protein F5Y05DRAFT_330304 [Hypoxylon sp. FL0543]|nr:hypothetical protein F5Y05DRAFT_330304 [Hypoxylon sp. FL0543]